MRILLLSALAVASAVGVAHAMPDAAQIATAFRELDTSRNNALDAREWQRGSFALFRAADKNSNDFIDTDELEGSTLAQDTFLRLDANRDGRLSVGEFMDLRREIFTVADIDRDDYLTFVEYELLMVFEASGWQDGNRSGRVEASELDAALARIFEQVDADRDGRLSPQEAGYMAVTRFARFDRDQDGKLSLEELVRGYRAEFGA